MADSKSSESPRSRSKERKRRRRSPTSSSSPPNPGPSRPEAAQSVPDAADAGESHSPAQDGTDRQAEQWDDRDDGWGRGQWQSSWQSWNPQAQHRSWSSRKGPAQQRRKDSRIAAGRSLMESQSVSWRSLGTALFCIALQVVGPSVDFWSTGTYNFHSLTRTRTRLSLLFK